MKLVIVESPKKSETITRYLGQDFKVLASEGHIRDLSTKGKGGLGIDVANNFAPDWEISPRKAGVIAKLKSAAKSAEEVYLATDPDREGEAISYHLATVLGLPLDTTKRLQFHEITKPAILDAMANPKTVDMKLVAAQETRRLEDRIIGFKVSSLLKKNTGLKSAGRVQSATLRMIVDRQEEIDKFVPQEYWTIDIEVIIEGKKYKASLSKVDGKPVKIASKEEADAILARIPEHLLAEKVIKAEKSIFPRPPFSTSTMQQEAYSKFHFSNARTQSIAQRLYEGQTIGGEHVGLITYMRTDSTRISPEFFRKHAVPYITETYGEEFLGSVRAAKSGKNIQDAHEAIRPTGTHRTPAVVAQYVSPEEAKLYRLIYCRAMASLMAPKKVERTSVSLTGNGLEFSLSGSRTLFKGFSVIYGEFEDDAEEGSLPEVREGTSLAVAETLPEQKFTKPEPSYNEASIVKAMEENGIGRPSTYATTIETLIKRRYVSSAKGVLTPTEDGKKTIAVLEKYFPDIVDTSYTADMETKLDKVESGDETFLDAMNEFYIPFNETFEKAREMMWKEPDQETGELCPICGRPLVVKKNRKGQVFIGCSGYKTRECTYIKKDPKPEPLLTGENCPDCGAPLVFKISKKGEKFIGCSNFPNCHYTSNIGEKKAKKPAVVYSEADFVKPCPKCKDGHLVVKKGKRTNFLACTNFPRCRYHEWLDAKKGTAK
ncbi:MAG: type I DNA topoisomerase [Bacilli bacterium]|nr:type I DNA topoisomerase [Bacilli bacterium]